MEKESEDLSVDINAAALRELGWIKSQRSDWLRDDDSQLFANSAAQESSNNPLSAKQNLPSISSFAKGTVQEQEEENNLD
jgi:hypothetical protein